MNSFGQLFDALVDFGFPLFQPESRCGAPDDNNRDISHAISSESAHMALHRHRASECAFFTDAAHRTTSLTNRDVSLSIGNQLAHMGIQHHHAQ
jgi:hypothetical protein